MFSGGYAFGKTKDNKGNDEPDKDGYYDNVSDCIRYIINFYFKLTLDIPLKSISCEEPSFITNENNNNIGQRFYQ